MKSIFCYFLLVAQFCTYTRWAEAGEDEGAAFAQKVEKAQNKMKWEQSSPIQMQLVLKGGGKVRFEGTMIVDPRGRVRMEGMDTVLVYDGAEAYVSPANSELPKPRFHVLTWSYFLLAPFKLRDPGAHLVGLEALPLEEGRLLPAARLTFDEGVGDTPDDWYILYRDPKTDYLMGMAYIVTYGTAVEEAEKEPHAIVFKDFVEVEGMHLPTEWKFYHWSRERGVYGEPLGEVSLSNFTLVSETKKMFSPPVDHKVAPLP